MRYYKLIYDYENDDNYANCNIASIGNMEKNVTINGEKIEKWNEVVFEYDSTEGEILTDYLANLYRWLLVSSKFRDVTDDIINRHVQYLPVKVLDRITKSEIESYCVANIITKIDALDLEHSKYDIFELDDEKIISIEKYALKGSQIIDKHIFKLESETIPVFVSEKLKEVIENSGLTGFRFLEVKIV